MKGKQVTGNTLVFSECLDWENQIPSLFIHSGTEKELQEVIDRVVVRQNALRIRGRQENFNMIFDLYDDEMQKRLMDYVPKYIGIITINAQEEHVEAIFIPEELVEFAERYGKKKCDFQ